MTKIPLRRAQLNNRPKDGLDVTVKSAPQWLQPFAPTWAMVRAGKEGTMSEADYTDQYRKILAVVSPHTWEQLNEAGRKMESITFLCYCKDGEFCHTNLLIDWLIKHFPGQYERGEPNNQRQEKPLLFKRQIP